MVNPKPGDKAGLNYRVRGEQMAQTNTIGKHRTTVTTDDLGVTRVKYHSTNVVTFDDSHIQLQSGGWHTATTKLRINQTSAQFGLGLKVIQRNFKWLIIYKGVPFFYTDGVVLPRDRDAIREWVESFGFKVTSRIHPRAIRALAGE